MKKLINLINRYYKFILFILGWSVALIISVFFMLGYELILPEGKTTLDIAAINTVTSWAVPTVLSIIAIIISIETARNQNKIALFEKRFNIYKQFLFMKEIVTLISKTSNSYSNVLTFQSLVAQINDMFDHQDTFLYEADVNVKIQSMLSKINESVFIFNGIDSKDVVTLINKFNCIVNEINQGKLTVESASNLNDFLDEFEKKHFNKIENQLYLIK